MKTRIVPKNKITNILKNYLVKNGWSVMTITYGNEVDYVLTKQI